VNIPTTNSLTVHVPRTGCYVSRCKLAFFKIRGDVVKHKLQIQDDKVDFYKVLITE
jgi:hypothetical protein